MDGVFLFAGFSGIGNLASNVFGPRNASSVIGQSQTAPPETGDTLELSDEVGGSVGGAPTRLGNLALDTNGLYRQVQAFQVSLNVQSFTMSRRSGGGRNALAAPGGIMSLGTSTGTGLLGRLHNSLTSLGLSDKNVRDLMIIGKLLLKLDPEALENFVKGIEGLAKMAPNMQATAPATPAIPGAPGTPATPAVPATPATPATPANAQFRLNYVSLSISITEVHIAEGEEGVTVSARKLAVRFERLEISLSPPPPPMLRGDPLVLDMEGDGIDIRPTSDGVVFDLTGSGQPVQTAFVQGDDGMLFYDANGNGLLDDGSELVGNRIDGLNAFEELIAADENADGKITSLDSIWSGLKVASDLDGDGVLSAAEVKLLSELGIAELSLLWERDEDEEDEGVFRAGTSKFTREDGSKGLMIDYYFGYRPVE